jgi:hypothetical protein
MTNNINITDFVSLVETYGVGPLRDTSYVTNIVNTSGVYRFTVTDIKNVAVGDIVKINNITNFDFKVKVSEKGTGYFKASQKYVSGQGLVSMGTISIVDVAGTYTRQAPFFFRGGYEVLNRLVEQVVNGVEIQFPVIVMTDSYLNFDRIYDRESNDVAMINNGLTFLVCKLAPETSYEDNMSLWESTWDETNNVANNFIENLVSFNANKGEDDQRNVYIAGEGKRFDNFMMSDTNSLQFDVKLTGTIFEIPVEIRNGLTICKNKVYS